MTKERTLPHPPTSPRRIVHPPSPASWFHQAVFYAIDVGSFRDSTGDGYGDIRGVAESLAYLQRMGIDAIWLLPFYQSPNRTTATTSATTSRSIRVTGPSGTSWT